tara:strand:- start:24868 stop:27804 length:2937 start_codon:yes stop_codon:yes gene_type:complete
MKNRRDFDTAATKEFLTKNKQYLTTGKDFEDMDGFKVDAAKADMVEEKIDDSIQDIKRGFPPESLFEYLKEHSSSTNGKRKSFILHETDDGYQLQHFLNNKLKEAVPTDKLRESGMATDYTHSKDELQTVLIKELNDRYEKTFARLPNSVKEKMLKHLIDNLKKGKREFGGRTSTDVIGTTSDVSESALKETFNDEATLNKVLNNFTLRGKTRGLNQRQIMGYTDDEGNVKGGIDISTVMLKQGRVTKKELTVWQRIIKNQKGAIKTKLAPIISIIEGRLKTGERVIHLEADRILGKLNLKQLSRRDSIYTYWEKIGTTRYDELKTAYNELRLEFGDLFAGKKYLENNEEVLLLLKEFKEFEKDMNNGTLNYVVSFPQMKLSTYSKNQKHSIIFEKFIQENNIATKKKDNSEGHTEIWESYSIQDGRYKDYITTDATGRQRDTREYDPTKGSAEKVTNRTMQDNIQHDEDGILVPGHIGTDSKGPKITNETLFMNTNTKELTQLGLELEEMEDIMVDPLYFYAFGKDSSPFQDVAIFSKELKQIKREMLSASRVGETVSEVDVDNKIFDYIKKLEDLVISEQKEFYLPISDTLKTLDSDGFLSGIGEETDIDNKLKRVGEFLEVISKFFDTGSSLSRSASPSHAHVSSSSENQEDPTMSVVSPGRKNRKNLLADIQGVGSAWSKFMDTMIEFYILPMNSHHRPFNDNIAETYKTNEKINRVWHMLTSDKADNNAFYKFLALEASEGYALLSEKDFVTFVELMQFISEPDIGVDVGELKNQLTAARKRVTWILSAGKKGVIADDVKIEFGAYFHKVLEENGMDSQDIWGKDSEEWHDMFNLNMVYPFAAMVYHVERNREHYTSLYGGARSGKGTMKVVQQFFEAMKSLKLSKSEYEQSLMLVHDEIRKIEGKPIFNNTAKLDNYDHIAKALNLMKEKYHLELTAFELSAIVKELNSMEELSIKHGVSKESVYFLKSNFR